MPFLEHIFGSGRGLEHIFWPVRFLEHTFEPVRVLEKTFGPGRSLENTFSQYVLLMSLVRCVVFLIELFDFVFVSSACVFAFCLHLVFVLPWFVQMHFVMD